MEQYLSSLNEVISYFEKHNTLRNLDIKNLEAVEKYLKSDKFDKTKDKELIEKFVGLEIRRQLVLFLNVEEAGRANLTVSGEIDLASFHQELLKNKRKTASQFEFLNQNSLDEATFDIWSMWDSVIMSSCVDIQDSDLIEEEVIEGKTSITCALVLELFLDMVNKKLIYSEDISTAIKSLTDIVKKYDFIKKLEIKQCEDLIKVITNKNLSKEEITILSKDSINSMIDAITNPENKWAENPNLSAYGELISYFSTMNTPRGKPHGIKADLKVEYKLRLPRIFLALMLYITLYNCLIYSYCRYKITI